MHNYLLRKFIVQNTRPFISSLLNIRLLSMMVNGENNSKDLDYIKKLKTLEQLNNDRFRSNALVPGSHLSNDVYGGVIFAQSVAAAETTVGEQFSTNAAHCFFIRKATVERPIEYSVTRLRDGRSFCTRLVQAIQDEKVIYCAQISLCVPEPSAIEHQKNMPKVKAPEELSPFFEMAKSLLQEHDEGKTKLNERIVKNLKRILLHDQIALFEYRPIEPNLFLGLEPHSVRPVRYWLKCSVPLEHLRDNRSINRFLLGYSTDATLVSTANRPHLSHGHVANILLSLDHSVHFHDDNFHVDDWLLCENVSTIAKNGRAFSLGNIWTRDGRLILSCTQESLSRSKSSETPSRLEVVND